MSVVDGSIIAQSPPVVRLSRGAILRIKEISIKQFGWNVYITLTTTAGPVELNGDSRVLQSVLGALSGMLNAPIPDCQEVNEL